MKDQASVVSASWLTNWRAELVYSPHVIGELGGIWDGTLASKEQVQELVDRMRSEYDVSHLTPPSDQS